MGYYYGYYFDPTYILVLIGAVFLLAMQVSWINAFAAMIPLVYPRLIYVGHACLHKHGEQL